VEAAESQAIAAAEEVSINKGIKRKASGSKAVMAILGKLEDRVADLESEVGHLVHPPSITDAMQQRRQVCGHSLCVYHARMDSPVPM
jgi:hypothetical protein